MKKIFILLALVFPFGASVASAANDKIVNKSDLPVQAQNFIDEHFGDAKLSYVKLETDFLVRSYEVALASGIKVEFSSKGEWEEVDCRNAEVPSAIVPVALAEYVKSNFEGEKVNRIERDNRGYELELSNGLELKFNKDFVIVDIDD